MGSETRMMGLPGRDFGRFDVRGHTETDRRTDSGRPLVPR